MCEWQRFLPIQDEEGERKMGAVFLVCDPTGPLLRPLSYKQPNTLEAVVNIYTHRHTHTHTHACFGVQCPCAPETGTGGTNALAFNGGQPVWSLLPLCPCARKRVGHHFPWGLLATRRTGIIPRLQEASTQ